MTQEWHGFEICLPYSIYLAAFLSKEEADKEFDVALRFWDDQIESYVLGTVEADTLDEALNAIRLSDWVSSTQLV